MADVFISYARTTARQAQAAAEALRGAGHSVWLDDDLPAHRAYAHVIEEQLDEARAALVIWSADAARSEWVMSEATRAREARKLVQASIDHTRLPMPFDQLQCVDLTGWTGDADAPGWRKVAASIGELLGAAPPPARASTRGRSRAASALTAEGERRHLTVLVCNLVGAPQLTARLDPEDWRAVASQYRAVATQALVRSGGHVARAAGDGLVAYFGYPQAREDAAECALRAGLDILQDLAGLNETLAKTHPVRLSVSVGVHAGTVVVAQGAGQDADLFGEAPGIAAKVQSRAAPDTVVMSGAVHDLVTGQFLVEDIGELGLDGVDGPVRLWRTLAPSAPNRRPRGFGPREPTAFIGREDEAQLLASRWGRVRDGEGQVVLLLGEPGIGKSRLMQEFRAAIAAEPHQWIDCAGGPFFANTPFHAVAQMLEQGLGWPADASAQDRLERLEQAVATSGMRAGEAVPLIAEVLNLPVADRYPPPMLSPEQRRTRLLAALAGWVFSATAGRPLVIAMEDLHWVDPSTLELLETLAEQGATAPLMLLCSARPQFRPPWPARGHHVHITLNRLNSRQTQELVAGLISRAGLPQTVVEAVIERTDGVPLFAEELTRLMLDRSGRTGEHEIPATLLDSLGARLDRLGRAKEVAQLGAVLGRDFSYDLLAAVCDLPEDELQSDLAALADAELIYARGLPPQASYRFKHALIQDAAYEALLKSQRRALHARVARAIVERFGEAAQPETLARHWTQAGEATPAIAAWQSAGDTAYARRAFKEAEEAYRQALAMLKTQPVTPERDKGELAICSALSRVLQLTRGYAAPETVEAATRARALAEKTGSVAQLIREEARIWRAVITSGDYAGAAALAEHVFELTRSEGQNPGRLVFAHNAQVQIRFYTGDLTGVEEHFEHLSAVMGAAGLRQAPGNNIIGIGVASLTAWALGRAQSAHERTARALAMARDSANPYDLAMALHFQGLLFSCERDAVRAEDAATKLLAVAQENDFSYAGDLARSTLGWARAMRGAAPEGVTLTRQAWAGLATTGARVGLTFGLTRLAEIQALGGAADEALETIDDALTANPQERVFRPDALRLRGELRLGLGERAAAEADLREAVTTAAGMGARAWALRAATSLARLLQAHDGAAAARDALAQALDGFPEAPSAADLEDATSLLSEASES